MSLLQLPERLKGPWEHLVIFTFGADLPFFENALWRQLSASCRNKIVLADRNQFLDACNGYARGSSLRHINQRYIADGTRISGAAHAKILLMTNAGSGRLLVGSGNLNPRGYASGGEMFTEYEYGPDDSTALGAFSAIREVIDYITEQRLVGPRALHHLRFLLEGTPWLFRPPSAEWMPVRHNLDESHLDQLVRAVSDEPVEQLTVFAPFYDPGLIALKQMIERLGPKKVRLLIQRERTSIDPDRLKELQRRLGKNLGIFCAETKEENAYLHAKVILAEQRRRSVIAQGSANLSQVALLRKMPNANLEVVNLLVGRAGEFDEVFDHLDLSKIEDVNELDVRIERMEVDVGDDSTWRLTSAEWRDDLLTIQLDGNPTDLRNAVIRYGHHDFPIERVRQNEDSLKITISEEEALLLASGIPVLLELSDGTTSNVIYPANSAQLDRELEARVSSAELAKVGGLDLDDEELERLLMALEETLIFDRSSLWRLAGREEREPEPDQESEIAHIKYSEIDYDRLRKHPKMRQYLRSRCRGTGAEAPTRLQVILSSIGKHFRGLVSAKRPVSVEDLEEALESEIDPTVETEEEAEAEQAERERRRLDISARVRNLLKRFLERYLSGLSSKDFQEIAGYEVMIENYAIFVHVLWRLYFNDWLMRSEVAEYVLRTLVLFWGSQGAKGFIAQLSEEERELSIGRLKEVGSTKYLIALLFVSGQATSETEALDLRFDLRDFWRDFVAESKFEITEDDIAGAWVLVGELLSYSPPQPMEIISGLQKLADFETRASLQTRIQEETGVSHHKIVFEKGKVMRPSLGREVWTDYLRLDPERDSLDRDLCIRTLRLWMRAEKLDYYRVASPAPGASAYYDLVDQAGLCWMDSGSSREERKLANLRPAEMAWDASFDLYIAEAERVPSTLEGVSVLFDAPREV